MPAMTYEFRGRTVLDEHGEEIGTVDELYEDELGDQPGWALVNTEPIGTTKTFVPIESVRVVGDDLQVPFAKAVIKDAPQIEAEDQLSAHEERTLFAHYGVPYDASGSTTAQRAPGTPDDAPAAPDHELSAPDTDEAITRSEEELHVGTESRESGRVRLRKYVVTENVQTTIPVSHEEVRVVREPITDANRDQAMSGPEISEAEHEVVLHEEEPVVEKRTVPKERVRLETETVSGERDVSAEIRKERIETEALPGGETEEPLEG